MKRICLNIICKNESHIIERMLYSALPLIDMIVAVDTGSCDNTIQLIELFGVKNKLPTWVFVRPFDDFASSRNYALEKLKTCVVEIGWDPQSTWGFNADCDERINILPKFDKQALEHDMLVLRQRIGKETFTRQGIFRLSKTFRWQSPVHEELVWTDPSITKKYEFEIEIIEEPVGASWKGNLEEKFLNYAAVLERYVNEGHYTFRSIYFIGDSYNAAATYCTDDNKSTQYYRTAERYFNQAIPLLPESKEVRFMLFKKIAENCCALKYPWPTIKENYLKAFGLHLFKGETLAAIVEHYIDVAEWESAYIYSQFACRHFERYATPENARLYVNEALYQWRFLFCYYYTALRSKRKQEAKVLYSILQSKIKSTPSHFTEQDILLIKIHSPLMLKIRNGKEVLLAWIQKLVTPITGHHLQTNTATSNKKIHYAA